MNEKFENSIPEILPIDEYDMPIINPQKLDKYLVCLVFLLIVIEFLINVFLSIYLLNINARLTMRLFSEWEEWKYEMYKRLQNIMTKKIFRKKADLSIKEII